MRKPNSPARSEPETILPHDHEREARQPYAKEVEDYVIGVATPPEEQGGQGASARREGRQKRRGPLSR